jgi:hypothetical protein
MTDYQNNDDEVEELDGSEGGGMSFLEHLEDFRWTVGRSLLAFATGHCSGYFIHWGYCCIPQDADCDCLWFG